MKYKPYDPKGRENENMLRTSHVKWTDRLINISGSNSTIIDHMYVKKTINIRQNTFTYRYIDLLVSVKFHHSNYCYTSWNWSHFIYNSDISWKTIFHIINKGKFNILSHWHASKLRIKPGYTFIKEKITLQMFNILPFFLFCWTC